MVISVPSTVVVLLKNCSLIRFVRSQLQRTKAGYSPANHLNLHKILTLLNHLLFLWPLKVIHCPCSFTSGNSFEVSYNVVCCVWTFSMLTTIISVQKGAWFLCVSREKFDIGQILVLGTCTYQQIVLVMINHFCLKNYFLDLSLLFKRSKTVTAVWSFRMTSSRLKIWLKYVRMTQQ